ncbi:BlaI family transcriptional regulator, penicillinase repressor [Faecalicatena contorta]|uniref:BlaI family transcriptional regulator, penicillinase repressor n=1 Tax=Faecalicatena contorta TaxID=39482 RepID=A0A315ZR79_9FIRM|nr:BlaI/MecI/CopY family transcriptional regulator [Faecalicatena contorta]PWJ48056.1 BlaI family penicillinase repressor [Faecalicatena contorta]SUQ15583.1 BlaI family transcriptional regulator, penicillinase repressor [Faecalicatena contorta]
MGALPQISEAEFEIMKIVWKHAPISTNEITEKLTAAKTWSPKTMQTLIKRLVTKGVLFNMQYFYQLSPQAGFHHSVPP